MVLLAIIRLRPGLVGRQVHLGHLQRLRVEQPDDLVAVQLAPMDERVGDPLDRILVRRHQVVGGEIGLAEQLLDHRRAASGRASMPASAVRCSIGLTICDPIFWKRFITRSRASSSDSSSQRSSTYSGPIPQAPTIQAARSVAARTSPPTPVEFSP